MDQSCIMRDPDVNPSVEVLDVNLVIGLVFGRLGLLLLLDRLGLGSLLLLGSRRFLFLLLGLHLFLVGLVDVVVIGVELGVHPGVSLQVIGREDRDDL